MVDDIKVRIVFDTGALKGAFAGGPAAAPTGGGGIGGAFMAKGIGGALTKLALPLMALKGIGDTLMKIFNVLKESSPHLKATMEIGKKSFMIFMRPFGDALSSIFRPVMMWLLRLAIAWLTWVEGPGKIELKPEREGEGPLGADPFWVNLWDNIIGGATDIGDWLKEKLSDSWDWTLEVGDWFIGVVADFWDWTLEVGDWFAEKAGELWTWFLDVAEWITGVLEDSWKWTLDFVKWITDILSVDWIWEFDFVEWIRGKFTDSWTWTWDFVGWIQEKISGMIGGLFGSGESKQAGGPIHTTGLYRLHAGEYVVPAGGRGGGINVTNNIYALDASSINSATLRRITEAVEESITRNMAGMSSQAWGK